MGDKIKVFVVDDSAVYRLGLSRLIEAQPDLAMHGSAADGHIALKKLATDPADIVLLDVEMPVMGGLEALPHIKRDMPQGKVIMVSSLTAKGVDTTLEALSLGADDYVLKPSSQEGAKVTLESFHAEILSKIRLFTPYGMANPSSASNRAGRPTSLIRPKIIAVGSSTGGPLCLEKFLGALGNGLPVPMVITQHMPPVFTKQLALSLSKKTGLNVVEGEHGMKLCAGTIYLAPGDHHMVVQGPQGNPIIEINQSPPENHCRPSVDVMYRSVAQHFGRNTLAVQLTGMGHDGMKGAEEIVRLGGEVIAQDKGSSVVWSMPSSVIDAGLASLVLPPEQIAAEITSRLSHGWQSKAAGV